MQSSSVRAMVGRTTSEEFRRPVERYDFSGLQVENRKRDLAPIGRKIPTPEVRIARRSEQFPFSSLLGIDAVKITFFSRTSASTRIASPMRRATKARKANRVRRRSHDPHSGISFEIHNRFGRAAGQRYAHQLSGVGLSSAGWPGPLHVEQPLPIRAGLRRPLFFGPGYDRLGIGIV